MAYRLSSQLKKRHGLEMALETMKLNHLRELGFVRHILLSGVAHALSVPVFALVAGVDARRTVENLVAQAPGLPRRHSWQRRRAALAQAG
jgi:hypothetical protein